MKKFLFLWFLLVTFFFFPQNIKAETIFDIPSDDRFINSLECTYHNQVVGFGDVTCEGLSSRYFEWNIYNNEYSLYGSSVNSNILPLGKMHSFDVEVGPSTLYRSYLTVITNGGWLNEEPYNSYYYNFKANKLYSINYQFLVPKDVDLYLNKADVQFTAFNVDDEVIENAINTSVVVGYSNSDDIHNISDLPDDYSGGLPNTDEFYVSTLHVQFQPNVDIDHLDFILGFPSIEIDDVQVNEKSLGENEFYSNLVYLGISDFSVTEISKFFAVPHGGGGINLDNPSKDDETIFSNLKTCDTLDIGCHVDNILTMIKNVFVRIGNFFVSIWEVIVSIGEFFADFFTVLGQVFIEIVTDIIIPDSDYLSIRFNAFSKFLSDKLGLISFPFEFTAHFLNRFLDIPNTPVKTITVPTISIGSFGTLIPGFTFNIAEYWEKPPFNQIYNIYLIFVHCFIVFCLYRLCVKKFNEIVGGCSM